MQQSLEMARMSVADGVTVIACTPHIFAGVYNNSGPDVRRRVDRLQSELDAAQIAVRLVSGGDVHVAPDLVAKLKSGEALSLNDSRYVLVEPPHHVLPPNIEGLFFDLLSAGYVPIVTHPERMSWIDRDYDRLMRLVRSGAWMQEDVSIAEFARLVAETVGYGGRIVYDAGKPDGTPRKLLDISRMAALGWRARTPLREGLRLAYQHFLTEGVNRQEV